MNRKRKETRKSNIKRKVLLVLWLMFSAFCFYFPHMMEPYLVEYDRKQNESIKKDVITFNDEKLTVNAGLSAVDFFNIPEVEAYDCADTVQSNEEETEPEEDVWIYPDENEDLLSSIIYYEAGSLSYETKLLVASVIINRMNSTSNDFKNVNTIEEVVSQHRVKNGKTYWQYSTYQIASRTLKSNKESKKAARYVLHYGTYDPIPLFQRSGGRYVNNTTPYCISDTEYFSY